MPEINSDSLKIARKFGMKFVFDCLRMFTNGSIDIFADRKVYGITCL